MLKSLLLKSLLLKKGILQDSFLQGSDALSTLKDTEKDKNGVSMSSVIYGREKRIRNKNRMILSCPGLYISGYIRLIIYLIASYAREHF